MSMQIKFTTCFQNVRLQNACMHRNVSCVHVRRSARPSWCPSEFQNSAAHSCFFVELGVKINGVYYRDVLLTQKLLPVIRQISGNKFVFQKDSAPAHRARETIIELFISPEQWPSNSPDLNPVDYKIWATMQQRVYQTKTRNVDELRQCLPNVWSSIEQDVIDASIDQWRVRLKACMRSGGGHFEHML